MDATCSFIRIPLIVPLPSEAKGTDTTLGIYVHMGRVLKLPCSRKQHHARVDILSAAHPSLMQWGKCCRSVVIPSTRYRSFMLSSVLRQKQNKVIKFSLSTRSQIVHLVFTCHATPSKQAGCDIAIATDCFASIGITTSTRFLVKCRRYWHGQFFTETEHLTIIFLVALCPKRLTQWRDIFLSVRGKMLHTVPVSAWRKDLVE